MASTTTDSTYIVEDPPKTAETQKHSDNNENDENIKIPPAAGMIADEFVALSKATKAASVSTSREAVDTSCGNPSTKTDCSSNSSVYDLENLTAKRALPTDNYTPNPNADLETKVPIEKNNLSTFPSIDEENAALGSIAQSSDQLFANDDKKSSPPGWRHCMGIILALLAGFFLTTASVAAKKLLESHMTTPQISVVRFTLLLMMTVPTLLWSRANPFSKVLLQEHGGALILRGFAGSGAFLLRVFTFSKLPLGDATTIMFSTPIFVGLFAKLFLHEPYHRFYLVATVFMLCGCTLISRPPFLFADKDGTYMDKNGASKHEEFASATDRLLGTVTALLATSCGAAVIILLRRLRSVNTLIVIFYFGFVGFITSTVLALCVSTLPVPTQPMQWVWIVLLAVTTNLGQYFFTRSLHYENANIISLVRTADVVWAFGAQIVIFNLFPQEMSIAGAIVISGSVIFLGIRKLIESLDTSSTTWQYLSSFLVLTWCFPTLRRKREFVEATERVDHHALSRSATVATIIDSNEMKPAQQTVKNMKIVHNR